MFNNRPIAETQPERHISQSSLCMVALDYAKRFRLSVLPCRPQGKEPLTRHGCKDASRDPALIKSWWEKWPNANIGIACGKVSNGLLVLDIDGDEGRDSLRRFESENGLLPRTPQTLTGKGEQYYFTSPAPFKNRVRLAPGIDIRHGGGYVIAPPSIHPNGRKYTWEISSHINDVPLAPMPNWLIRLLTADESGQKGKGTSYWIELFQRGAVEGSRNQAVASLSGHLLRHFIHPDFALEILLIWNEKRNRPPLPEDEVMRTVDSIAGIELRRREEAAHE